jgi:hypothetical protein
VEKSGLRLSLLAGLLAGLTGGVLIEAYNLAAAVIGGTPFTTAFSAGATFIASTLLGPTAAATNPNAVLIGVVLNFVVAIAWALGFVYLARSTPAVLSRPVISGICFGFVVFVFMGVVLITAGVYRRPSVAGFENGLISHLFFYGLPVGLIVGRMLTGAARGARVTT